jgi:NAD(P)-dependent dehydrogenase (short-subunit alcohol dehydrogenase family)
VPTSDPQVALKRWARFALPTLRFLLIVSRVGERQLQLVGRRPISPFDSHGDTRMNIDLSGKTALVTGSTAGIGHAIAKGLAASGASVVINGRGQDKVDAAVKKLEGAGAKVRGIAADVSTAAGCKALVAALPEVDILVNNAGIFEPKDFFEIPDQDWSRFFEVNVMSGVRLSRAYLKGMLKRNWGRVVFISSESALNIPVEMIHYGMTKTAQLAVARGLAQLARGTGVTVNSVLPGPTMSEGVETFVKDLARQNGQSVDEAAANFVKQHRPSSLLQRFASVEEIANMVVYAASQQASATNGAALRAEGGIINTIA